MYLIRRVFKVKSGKTKEAADLIKQMANAYELGGRQSPRVYWSGYTVPGPANLVYMDWIEESLQSPFRSDAEPPVGDLGGMYRSLNEIQEDSYIEFYELA